MREDIKKDLLEQLERKGVRGEHYTDLINDYMSMWDIKNELINDIEERGVNVMYQNGKEQWGYKKNDSIGELNKTNGQMMKILQHLEIKTINEGDNDKSNMEM